MRDRPRDARTYLRWPVDFVSGNGAILDDADGERVPRPRRRPRGRQCRACASRRWRAPIAEQAASAPARLQPVRHGTGVRPWRNGSRPHAGCVRSSATREPRPSSARSSSRAQSTGATNAGVTRDRCTDGAFHGRTLGALDGDRSAGKKRSRSNRSSAASRTCPFGDDAAFGRGDGDRTSLRVLLEPIQGEAGVIVPPVDYLAKAGALRRESERLVDPRRGPDRARADRARGSPTSTQT